MHAFYTVPLLFLMAAGCSRISRGQQNNVVLGSCDTVSRVVGRSPSAFPSKRPSAPDAGLVVGTVEDNRTGAALANVTVRLSGATTVTVVTGVEGEFSSDDLAPGLYHVLVTRIGYDAVHDSLRVTATMVDTLRYRLQYRSCP